MDVPELLATCARFASSRLGDRPADGYAGSGPPHGSQNPTSPRAAMHRTASGIVPRHRPADPSRQSYGSAPAVAERRPDLTKAAGSEDPEHDDQDGEWVERLQRAHAETKSTSLEAPLEPTAERNERRVPEPASQADDDERGRK